MLRTTRGSSLGEEGYLSHLISPPVLVGIQCPRCQCLLVMLENYSGSAWRFLDTVKCHLGKNSLSYAIVECLKVLELQNCTYLNNHQPEYAKTGTNL